MSLNAQLNAANASEQVKRVSGGRALRGISLIYPSALLSGPSVPSTMISRQVLLNPPSQVTVTNPTQPSFAVIHCFSKLEESLSFCKDVIDKGWTMAGEIHAGFMLSGVLSTSANISGGGNNTRRGEETTSSNERISEVCITQCVHIPMGSFQLPRNQIMLSDSALLQAQSIQDDADADKFMDAYNPFVSLAAYHLGGVFLRQVAFTYAEETSKRHIVDHIQKEMFGSAKIKADLLGSTVPIFSMSLEGSFKSSNENESSTEGSLKVHDMKEVVMACGPTTARSPEELQSTLKSDPLSWAIIDKDKDSEDTLLGVWDVLLRHSELTEGDNSIALKRAARILCDRWVYLAQHQVNRRNNIQYVMSNPALYRKLIDNAKLFLAEANELPCPQSTIKPLPLVPRSPPSLNDLIKHLEALFEEASSGTHHQVNSLRDNAVHKVGQFIKQYDAHTQDQRHIDAVNVLKSYGFHSGVSAGNQIMDDTSVLNGIIQDLKNSRNPVDNSSSTGETCVLGSIPESAWSNEYIIRYPCSETINYHFHYSDDIVVDRNFNENQLSTPQDFARRYIDCLRHRVNPVEHLLPHLSPQQTQKCCITYSSDEESDDEDAATCHLAINNKSINLRIQHFSTLELLIYIFQHSDLPTQIEISGLLLSQRASTLLAFPSKTQFQTLETANSHALQMKQLCHCIDALQFVNVAIQNEQRVCIAEDAKLLRVMFLSEKEVRGSHSATVASRILDCDFVSQHNRRKMGQLWPLPVIEVGIGFVKAHVHAKDTTCLAFHVTGPYQQLLSFIESIADVVILELAGQASRRGSHWEKFKEMNTFTKMLQWQETDVGEGFDKRNKLIQGQESYLVDEIGKFLLQQRERMAQKCRKSLAQECMRCFHPDKLIDFNHIQDVFDKSHFSLDIREDFKLQKSLAIEAQAFFESLQLKDDPARQKLKSNECIKQRTLRSDLAKNIIRIPIIQLFYQLLCQPNAESRMLSIMSLGRALTRKMQPILKQLSTRVDETYQAYNKGERNDGSKKAYLKAKQEYVDKSVGIDNLWRELSLIFEADPDKERPIAQLAAQHLLDGFPVEIFDGDAGMYRKTWVETVLLELGTMTRSKVDGKEARIFVLSVMGLQSSGKSTMLNLMFGTRLQTSAGRCTRGVYLQLVQSDRPEYDYVMLIDTEGLRSNEYFGLDQSQVRDNRLATFGMLPADASVFMVTNEDDSGLKEVLPMVLLAFKSSSIAEKHSGRIKSKVFFVYRSVDINDSSRLKLNKQKLHEYLRDAAELVCRMSGNTDNRGDQLPGIHIIKANDLLQMVFSELRVLDDERKSDVRCMGNLKRGGVPPADTPEWSYGEAVMKLREHIHHRVTDDKYWKSTTLAEWSDYLTKVWDCICTADFELNFRSCVEYSSYMELEKTLQAPKMRVAEKYFNVFTELEKRVREMKVEEMKEENSDILFKYLESNVKDVVSGETEHVRKMLKHERWTKWETEKLEQWKVSCRDMEKFYKRRVEDLENGARMFECVVTHYESSCKCEIVKRIEGNEWEFGQGTKEEKTKKFDEFFQNMLDEVEHKYPRIGDQVRDRVMKQYSHYGGLSKKYDLHTPPKEMQRDETNTENWWSNLKGLIFKGSTNTHNALNEDEKLECKLLQIIEEGVKDLRQYSEVAVLIVIKRTNHAIENTLRETEKKRKAHFCVKETLIRRLKDIQSQWDEEHNVAGKLRSYKPRLLSFFLDKVEGLEATAMLIRDLHRVLEDELQDQLKRLVISSVASVVGRKDWMMDWRVLRDFMDYHLLHLMERQQIKKVIDYVHNESNHFQSVIGALLEHVIRKPPLVQEEWEILLEKVERCVQLQTSSWDTKLSVFLLKMKDRMERDVDHELAHKVFSSVHQDHLKAQDIVLDREFYEERVPMLCDNLKKIKMPSIEGMLPTIIQGIKGRLEALAHDQCRPRCEASCPRCGSACFHSKGHDLTTTKHDCIHQIKGLCGIIWDKTCELSEKTCLQSFEDADTILFDCGARVVSYKDFTKEFPDWKTPANNNRSTIRVRECIFFKYQKELIDFFRKDKEIMPCPPKKMFMYNHNVKLMHTEVKNRLIKLKTNLDELHKVFQSL